MHRIETYITLALIFIFIINVLYLPILLYLKRKEISIIRQLSYIGLICLLFLILFSTILFVPFSFHPKEHILNIVPFNWIEITSLLLTRCISLKETQEWLGHSNFNTTENIYAHLNSNAKQNSANALSNIFAQKNISTCEEVDTLEI